MAIQMEAGKILKGTYTSSLDVLLEKACIINLIDSNPIKEYLTLLTVSIIYLIHITEKPFTSK